LAERLRTLPLAEDGSPGAPVCRWRLREARTRRHAGIVHEPGIAVASDGGDLSVHDLNVLGERNDAEHSVDVYECNAMLAIHNEPDDIDALHDAREIIESFPKRCSASICVGREFADDIRVKGKSGRIVVAHCIDVLLHDLNDLFAQMSPAS